MQTVELSAGSIEYDDTGADGPVLVLTHGLLMDGSLWRHVVRELRADYRCVVPTLPLGSHRIPMRKDADLSPRGIGALVAEFLERLDLRDVTLVGSDTGAFQFTAGLHPERIARLVVTSCEALENFPAGLPGWTTWLAARLPGGVNAALQPFRWRALARLPIAYGLLTKRPIPDQIIDAWLRPALTQPAIRRDLTKHLLASAKGDMFSAADGLRHFDHPALVIWAREDRVMPLDCGRRLAALLPQGRLIEVGDSSTLIPEDQPGVLSSAIRQFVSEALAREAHGIQQ